MRYFKKELFSNGLYLPSGGRVPFDLVGSNTGALATEDPEILGELEKAMNRHVGGVSEIDAQQFEELKKNPPVNRFSNPLLSPQVINQSQMSEPSAGQEVVAAVESEPLTVPEKIPLTAKVKDMKRRRTMVGDIMAETLKPQQAA